jgi:hypothetical protein
MKNYWVFGLEESDARGGMGDFLVATRSFEEALEVAHDGSLEGKELPYFQIVDIRNPNRYFLTRSESKRQSDSERARITGSPIMNVDGWIE